GLDILVSNAGIAPTGRIENLSLETWEKSLAVNATGHFLVAREAVRMLRAQGLGGSLIFNVTKNVPAPGADFGAYSCAKAAEAQLARILAVENGQYGIRCNLLNPDAVFEAGLWTPELKAERARAKGIPIEQFEESIRQSNLLKVAVTAEDVAQAALWLASDKSAKTTGAMIPIDGGLIGHNIGPPSFYFGSRQSACLWAIRVQSYAQICKLRQNIVRFFAITAILLLNLLT